MYLIAVDSGHGMTTAGKRTPALPKNVYGRKKGGRIKEKEFNKPTAEYLIEALERCGFKTINVSPGTKDVPLGDRFKAANKAKADAFISKHYNAFQGKWGTHSGIETVISQYASSKEKKLAKLVQNELVKEHKRRDRGVKTDIRQSGINIAVLRHTNMPAILTESGFMDNLKEASTMLDPDFQKADAEATCRGICKFFGVTYVSEVKSSKPSAPAAPSKPAEDKPYSVQVGAFSVKAYAEDRLQAVKKAGPTDAEIILGSDAIYRVLIGVKSKAEADEVVKKLKKAGLDSSIVHPVTSVQSTADKKQATATTTAPKTIKRGSRVKVKKGAKTYEGVKVSSFIFNGTYTVDEIKGNRAVLDKKGICTAFKLSDLTLV